MKILDSLLGKFIDFCVDFKFNISVIVFGMYLGQGNLLKFIRDWITTYVSEDFTFGQFLLVMILCKFVIKCARGWRGKIPNFDFNKEFYDTLAEIIVYIAVVVATHGFANYTIDGLKQTEFNSVPRVILGGLMVFEFKNVLNAAGLNISKIIDNFTEFSRKLKSIIDNGKEGENSKEN